MVGYPVQPVGQHLAGHYRGSFADKDQESGLESVLSVVMPWQEAAADPKDHRAMSLNDGGKGIVISLGNEAVQELPIRLTAAGSWPDGLTKMLDNPLQLAGRHLCLLPGWYHQPSIFYFPEEEGFVHDFLRFRLVTRQAVIQ